MLIKKTISGRAVLPSEITSERTYFNRRSFLTLMGGTSLFTGVSAQALPEAWLNTKKFAPAENIGEKLTPEDIAKIYNNFYEFGTGKSDPREHAHRMTTEPWNVEIAGLVEKPGMYALEDLLKNIQIEERIYRLRCVEAWSMVIPWLGFPVNKIIAKAKPLGAAKYVSFTTLRRPSEMPGVRSVFSSIDFPYVEGLRMDEANHDLAIFAVGMYGKLLPNQNGAPFRLVVPWKYGFKSIKSIVKIDFTEDQPATTWNLSNAREYGFYSNVNPNVDHPRWSQATERRLPSSLFNQNRIETRLFNGYPEVGNLYSGMDLRRFY